MFDWDRFNDILAPESELPPNCITAVEYAKRYGVIRQTATTRLRRLEELGKIKSVLVKHVRYYYFEDGANAA